MTGYFRKYVSSGRWRSGGFEFEGPHGEPSNIFSKLVFQLAGEKKRTMSCSGEARFRVLIIQHTPNKWASFLESTVASRQSNALRLLVAHLMISRRPYGESFCHQSKSPGTKLHDLRTNSSRHEPILILYIVVICIQGNLSYLNFDILTSSYEQTNLSYILRRDYFST